MRYATLGGGKRLRAFLVMESASLFGVNETCAARVAASVEMMHAYSLVHDDLPAMDDDDLRRGKPSTHKAFDEATAILAGDALQCRAFEILGESDTHSDPQARCELVMALGAAAGARGMAGGQMIDMVAEGQVLDSPAVTDCKRSKPVVLSNTARKRALFLAGPRRSNDICLPPMGVTSARRSRSPTTCWMWKVMKRRSARPPERTPWRARQRWCRSWDWNWPELMPICWPARPRPISTDLAIARRHLRALAAYVVARRS